MTAADDTMAWVAISKSPEPKAKSPGSVLHPHFRHAEHLVAAHGLGPGDGAEVLLLPGVGEAGLGGGGEGGLAHVDEAKGLEAAHHPHVGEPLPGVLALLHVAGDVVLG